MEFMRRRIPFAAALLSDRAFVWLATALLINMAVCVAITAGLMYIGESPKTALKATATGFATKLLHISDGTDSWYPMILAYNREMADPESGMYSVFDTEKIKFQYPPTSLILLDAIPRRFLELMTYDDGDHDVGAPFAHIVGRLSQFAAFLSILVSIVIFETGLRRWTAGSKGASASIAWRIFLAFLLGITFYPLVKGHNLGQIQIYLDLVVACAVLFYLLNWDSLAGICLGLCCLVKPQFALVLLWSVVRRRWSFALGMGCVFGIGIGMSFARFGLSDNLAYLELLHTIARDGEVFWPNQSVNGLLNRFLLNGDPLKFAGVGYAAFDSTVYIGTMICAFAIFVASLWPFRPILSSKRTELLDLLIVLIAATISSPIAWEHHYGIFLPVYAGVVAILLNSAPLNRRTTVMLAVSFAAVANILKRPDLVFMNRWVGIFGSHIFFGGLILLILLLIARSGALSEGRNEKNFGSLTGRALKDCRARLFLYQV
jgi:alpha-1,2-mannosyltransferase